MNNNDRKSWETTLTNPGKANPRTRLRQKIARLAMLAGAATVFVLTQADSTQAQFWGQREAPLWGPRNDSPQMAPVRKAKPKPKSPKKSAKREGASQFTDRSTLIQPEMPVHDRLT